MSAFHPFRTFNLGSPAVWDEVGALGLANGKAVKEVVASSCLQVSLAATA